MGTWAGPFTVEAAKEFAAILSADTQILPEHAMERMGQLVGDDTLYDEADHRSKLTDDSAWVDFRGHAAAWVAGWLSEGDVRWQTKWDRDAVAILNAALDDWNSKHPPAEFLTIDIRNYFDWDPEIGLRPRF